MNAPSIGEVVCSLAVGHEDRALIGSLPVNPPPGREQQVLLEHSLVSIYVPPGLEQMDGCGDHALEEDFPETPEVWPRLKAPGNDVD